MNTSALLATLSLLAWIAFCSSGNAQANGLFAAPDPATTLQLMEKAADWDLAQSNASPETGWIDGSRDVGIMALAGISGKSCYRDAMLKMAADNKWMAGPSLYNADHYCIGQTYEALYFLYRDPRMIAPLRRKMDDLLEHPAPYPGLDVQLDKRAKNQWSWCDALFMAPPAFVEMTAATGDNRYMDYAVSNWWRTASVLYDPDARLFYRDTTFLHKTDEQGKKIFWSRGNGWVLAGLAHMLQYLPTNDPQRPRFEALYRQLAESVLALQQADGLWRSSLLDKGSYSQDDSSGSAFLTYALAWGINQGILTSDPYRNGVLKAWKALSDCVQADGRFTHVQPVGAGPSTFDAQSTAPYGVGAFLLAGSEVYRMGILQEARDRGADNAQALWQVSVTNPSPFRRNEETVELKLDGSMGGGAPGSRDFFNAGKVAVMESQSPHVLDSQVYSETGQGPDTLLFQADLAPGETRRYLLVDARLFPATPLPIQKAFARYVPERHDDFAWESDRIAHRIYGKDLETWQREPLTSSGVDVWIKRTRNLVVNDMYRTMKLFNTNGPSQDDYRVGRTRGCGGLGIWENGRLYVSKNWRQYHVITSGPIRAEFDLVYEPWDVNGRKISETKRIRIDAGSSMSLCQSTFASDQPGSFEVGVGLAERPGNNLIVTNGDPQMEHWTSSTSRGLVVEDAGEGWLSYWQPQDFAKGSTSTAILLPKDSILVFTNDNPNLPQSAFRAPLKTVGEGQPPLRNLLAITQVNPDHPLDFYFGAGWDEGLDYKNADQWNQYVQRFAQRRDHPLQIHCQ